MISLTLDAVIVAVTGDEPRLLVVDDDNGALLPSVPLDVDGDPTLELGLRRGVREQTGLEVGYAEQLYTFGDQGRRAEEALSRPLSVAYLALVQESEPRPGAKWLGLYDLMPWEDHRETEPASLDSRIRPQLDSWADASDDQEDLRERVQLAFGPPWDGIRVVERYELLYEAGLVDERAVDRGDAPLGGVGTAMQLDYRRIAAAALARLRGKLTYRPVVFELVPDLFTLFELQRVVEALAGVPLHKQNFRRLIERSGLVEGTGERSEASGGRPAELFRYRPAVLLERPRPGVGQPYR